MKKRLLSIVTATAMALTALPLTVNAAELDEYLNSSNEVIAEFFDGFSLSNEYETENATILIKPNNYFIRLYEQDYSTIMFYPSSKEDIYTISAAVKEYFPKAYYPAELYSEHENEIYFEKYGYFEVANVNASSEQIKKVCDEIVLKYEVDKIVLRKTDYSGGLYDIDNREDSIFIYSQLRDIYLYDECVLFSKDTENADEELILHTIMNTKTVWNPINKTTTTTAESVTTDTPVTKANGDANCDGTVNMADAVLIMQSFANPNKYGINGTDDTHITAQGEFNGDMDGNGLTNADALEIQKIVLKLS